MNLPAIDVVTDAWQTWADVNEESSKASWAQRASRAAVPVDILIVSKGVALLAIFWLSFGLRSTARRKGVRGRYIYRANRQDWGRQKG